MLGFQKFAMRSSDHEALSASVSGSNSSTAIPTAALKLSFDGSKPRTLMNLLWQAKTYVAMAERDIYPLGPDQVGIYDPQTGKLKPQYAAFVDRLRELVAGYRKLDGQAKELKVRLQALN